VEKGIKEMETVTLRKSGIEVLGDIPWGTHLCQYSGFLLCCGFKKQ
jgi:hypothetical protein